MRSEVTTVSAQALCTPHTCRITCALQVIDELLRLQNTAQNEEVDSLLDLRWLLRQREDAEAALALFFELRRTMEDRHHHAFYRLRRWFENQVEATVRLSCGTAERVAVLKLNWQALQSVRFQCWQSVREPGESASLPRVRFTFRKFDESGSAEIADATPDQMDTACLA